MAATEADPLANVFSILKGNVSIFSSHKHIFKNLKPLEDKFADAQPDCEPNVRKVVPDFGR